MNDEKCAASLNKTAPSVGELQENKSVLKAANISFSYGEKQVLENIDVTLTPGKILGLLGPNGAGKSTLLSILCGDVLPNCGSVEWDGKNFHTLSRRERSRVRAVMPQKNEFPFAYCVRDVVEMARVNIKESHESKQSHVREAMKCADVDVFADRNVMSLSGGEQARVTFARVLAQDTPVVFLDEPIAALDISHQEKLMGMCQKLASSGVAIAVVLHDLNIASAYCDHVLLLEKGKIAAAGSPHQVFCDDLLSRVYGWPMRVKDMSGELYIFPQRT